jgi:hypothetical protein
VTINRRIKLICSSKGEFHWNAHPLNFIESSGVLLDVFIDDKRVNEAEAFEALCGVYGYPLYAGLRDVFCNNLLGNRIRRASQPMAFKLANQLKIQVTWEKDEVTIETQNGVVFTAKRSTSIIFFYYLARLIRSGTLGLENIAFYCIEAALTCGIRDGTMRNVTRIALSELESLAKAIAYAEDPSLVMLVGHYNVPAKASVDQE